MSSQRYHYGPPPAWAAQAKAQAPHWGQYNQQYNQGYQQHAPPFIPPRPQNLPPPPQQNTPAWYPQPQQQQHIPTWGTDPYAHHARAAPPPPPPEDADPASLRSNQWPKLSGILACDTSLVRFKVSGNKPSQEILASTFYMYRNVPANATPTFYMRIFSKHFPWSIEISTGNKDITCSDVWNAVWASLQQPILDSEWGMLCASGGDGKKRIEEVMKANKKRCDLNSFADRRVLRCDFLGENLWYLGLEKDEEFESLRLMPGSEQAKKPVPDDTWLVKMGK
ncbi:hypothetical protein NP233_g1132 [Leucocoprinus birnbaumii]|uniref:DUF6699 domain-containing protein n=1 Tax=Leucocoprinus birnbaumii TaxID=56174 RepID=A0AAD5YV48_9AGAR|nr:hypothetical protein NP233_g1132 [Leucocoprinus birnbaumii]